MGPIVFDQVKMVYGSKEALNLSVTFQSGKVTALLGPNGAGKTTLVSLLLGLKKPSGGTVTIGARKAGDRVLRERIGAMLQESPIADGLKVKEMLQLFRSYYRNPLPLDRLLHISGLGQAADKRASALSGGQKRRLAFALAMAGDPDMIVLDEPTTGMDVESRIRFWDVIKALAGQGKTILLTTHYLEEADAVADRITVIADGRLIAEGTPAQLKAALPLRNVTFRVADAAFDANRFYELPGVAEVTVSGQLVQLMTDDSDQLLPHLLQCGIAISDIQVHAASLESVFRRLTQQHVRS